MTARHTRGSWAPRRRPQEGDDTRVAAVKTEEPVKGFHPKPWLCERDLNYAPKRDATPTGITVAGAKAQGFRPEPLNSPHRGLSSTCPTRGKTCRHQTKPPEHDLGTATAKAPPTPGSPSATSIAVHTANTCHQHRRQDACRKANLTDRHPGPPPRRPESPTPLRHRRPT